MAKPTRRDNFGKLQKYATIRISAHTQQVADEMKVNIQKVVADKLEETYIGNIEASYTPRSSKSGSYIHTDTLTRNIHIETEGNVVKAVLNENEKYNQISERTTGQVYKFLTEGTTGRRILQIL